MLSTRIPILYQPNLNFKIRERRRSREANSNLLSVLPKQGMYTLKYIFLQNDRTIVQ